MKACPFCQGPSELRTSREGRPFGQCIRCGAASQPAISDDRASLNWGRVVRAPESIPGEWAIRFRDTFPVSSRAKRIYTNA